MSPACDAWPEAMLAATYACVKYCSPWITPSTTAKRITGLTRRERHPAQPLQRSGAVELRRLVQVLRHVEHRGEEDHHRVADPQRPSRISDGFAQCGDLNQSGPSMPRCESSVFTGPVAGLRM